MPKTPDSQSSRAARRLTRFARTCAVILGIGLSSAVASSAWAQSNGVIHRVSPRGESYEDLADHYYGKRYLAYHLRVQNGRAEPLLPGTSIIIPTFVMVPVKRGQSMQAFAEAYLSDGRRAEYLAELHGLRGKDRAQPKPGTKLRVVPSLGHRVRPGESMRTIARLYYRDASPERVKLLCLYNHMPESALRSGMSIRIPLDMPEFNHVLVSARAKKAIEHAAPEAQAASAPKVAPPPAASTEKALAEKLAAIKRKSTVAPRAPEEAAPTSTAGSTAAIAAKAAPEPESVEDALESLERACSDGEYDRCEEGAKKLFLQSKGAAVASRVELLSLRAVALIALGRPEESKEVFRALLKLDPEYDLDLYRTSPKVLDVFQAVAER